MLRERGGEEEKWGGEEGEKFLWQLTCCRQLLKLLEIWAFVILLCRSVHRN